MDGVEVDRKIPDQLILLSEISRVLASEADISSALSKLLEMTTSSLGLSRGMIAIRASQSDEIRIEQATGLPESSRLKGRYRLGEGVVGRVVESGKAAVIPRASEEPRFLNRTGTLDLGDGDIAFLCVPIQSRLETIGAIAADRPSSALEIGTATLERDLRLLEILATMVYQAVQLYRARNEEMILLREENARLMSEVRGCRIDEDIGMIGNSRGMRELRRMIAKVAATRATVLILGESGVGKELVAKAIHGESDRAGGPFVAVNVCALAEHLVESELFGHEKGAFTGAIASRTGKFEEAHRGTIFLDEIGELSQSIQTKLLRVLQERTVERVGSHQTRELDIRLIAATNRNLEEMVRDGSFREDLFYRLNVVALTVPPLRERRSDVPLLADFFVEQYSEINGKQIQRISTPALDQLMSYHWPGNVRELQNCIERAVIMSDDEVIHAYHLPPSLQTARETGTGSSGTLSQRIESLEREMIVEALKETAGNISKAAGLTGYTVRMLGIRMKRFGIDYRLYRSSR
ncbi:MAG: sigma 54-interacting transcriptional regulator [Alkalispirochaetaceae bacterium]